MAGTGRRAAPHQVAVTALGIVLCLFLAACSSNKTSNTANSKGAAGTATPRAGSAGTSSRSFAKAPSFTIDPNKGYVATIKTDKGEIVVQLNAKAAPLTVNNFVFLARQHFYDGLTCHRVLPDFVAQCGDPSGTGNGGPGYTLTDESSPLIHTEGAIAMARTNQPNSAGSQFYITMAPQPDLDGKYTVFGQVASGLDVVRSLTPRDPSSNPTAPPGDRITSITIAETGVTPTPFVPVSPTPVGPLAPAAATGTPSR